MNEAGKIPSTDRRWLWGFGIFTALLTLAPYLLAFVRQDADWVFTGFLFGVDDGNSYIAKMLRGQAGDWTFQTPYTTFSQKGLLFIFLPYLLLGKLAAPPELHLQLIVLYHLFRAAAILGLVFAVYGFIALFEPRQALRRFGTVLAVFGGGLGWLLLILGQDNWLGSLPLDVYSPETFGFLAVLGLPHLAAARALLLYGLRLWILPHRRSGALAGAQAGLAWLVGGLFNPLSAAIGWLAAAAGLGAWAVIPARRGQDGWTEGATRLLWAVLVSSPVVVYSAAASQFDPFFRLWTTQNQILSPHPLHYLAAFGLFLPWALRGARELWRDASQPSLIPILWVALLPALAYAPVDLQRRLPEGVFVALIILVIRGMGARQRGASWMRRDSLLLLAFPTSLFLLAGSFLAAWNRTEPVFRPSAEVSLFTALAEHASDRSVVLAPLASANPLPAFAPVRVVVGHGPESIGFDQIRPRVERFFSGEMTPDQAAVLLEEFGVDYVIAVASFRPPAGLVEVEAIGEYRLFQTSP